MKELLTKEQVERLRELLAENGEAVALVEIDALCDLALQSLEKNAAPQDWAMTDPGAKNMADTYRKPAGAAPIARLVEEIDELEKLFKKATGYTVEEYEKMVEEVRVEVRNV